LLYKLAIDVSCGQNWRKENMNRKLDYEAIKLKSKFQLIIDLLPLPCLHYNLQQVGTNPTENNKILQGIF